MKTTANNTSRNRSRGPRRGRRGGRPQGTSPSKSAPPKPQSLWERILGFIGMGPKPKQAAPARKSSTPDPRTPPAAQGGGRSSSGSAPAAGSAPRAERQKRVPESVEVTSSRLYVGNLSFDASEADLSELFNGVGQVQYAEVVSNPHTHRSKGFAFVQMQTIEEAKRAVRELHNKDFMGRPLVVSGAKSQREQDAEDQSA